MYEEQHEVFEIDGIKLHLASVHSTQARAGWTTDPARSHLIVNLSCRMDRFEAATHARLYLGAPTIGEFSWLPPDADFNGWYGSGSIDFLEISAPPHWQSPNWPRLAAFDLRVLKITAALAGRLKRRRFEGIAQSVRALWAHLVRSQPRIDVRRGAPLSAARFEAVQRSIAAAPKKLRSARDLAEYTGAGLDGLNRTFQSRFGLSAARYLDAARLRTARRLICRTQQPIGAIALETGFSSQPHLTDRMRNRIGVTPRQLRMLAAGHADPHV